MLFPVHPESFKAYLRRRAQRRTRVPRPASPVRLYPTPPPGHSLLCCTGWQPITTLPHVCPICQRRYLEVQP